MKIYSKKDLFIHSKTVYKGSEYVGDGGEIFFKNVAKFLSEHAMLNLRPH